MNPLQVDSKPKSEAERLLEEFAAASRIQKEQQKALEDEQKRITEDSENAASSPSEVFYLPEGSGEQVEMRAPPVASSFQPEKTDVVDKSEEDETEMFLKSEGDLGALQLADQLRRLSITDLEPPLQKAIRTNSRIILTADKKADSIEKINSDVSMVTGIISEIKASQKSIAQSLYWRKCQNSKEFLALATTIKRDISRLDSQRSTIEHLWGQVAVISDDRLVPGILKKVQYLELIFGSIREACRRMVAILDSKTFQQVYDWYKKIVVQLYKIENHDAATGELLIRDVFGEDNDFFTALTQEHREIDSLIVRNEIKKIYLDAALLFLQAMRSVEQGIPEDDDKNREWWDEVSQKIEGQSQKLASQVSSSDKGEINLQNLPQAFSNGTLSGSFCFNSSFMWFPNMYWATGYYPAVWPVIDEMQNLAKKVVGLSLQIEQSINDFIAGKFVDDSSMEIEEESHSFDTICNTYDRWYESFQIELESLKKKLFTQELNRLVFDAIDYSSGLSGTLLEISISLGLLKQVLEENRQFNGVLTSQVLLSNYLQSKQEASSRGITSLEKIEAFYSCSQKVLSTKKDCDRPGLTTFVEKTSKTLEAILGERGNAILALTRQEQQVWHWIIGQKPLDELFDPNQSKDELPLIIISYIEKSITKLIYSGKKFDSKIDILIHLLSTQDSYQDSWFLTLNERNNFKGIVEFYYALRGVSCLDDDFKEIAEVFFIIHKASLEKRRDPLAYGKAWQKLAEYYNFHKEEWNDQRNALVDLAYKELSDIAHTKGYIKISFNKTFSITDEEFKAEKLNFDEIKMRTESGEYDIGGIYRGLSFCIWGVTKEIEERVNLTTNSLFQREDRLEFKQSREDMWMISQSVIGIKMQGEITRLLYEDEFLSKITENKQEGRDVLDMIHENTIQKILSGKDVIENEMDLLIKGRIRSVIRNKSFELANPEIFYVIAILLQNKHEQITNDMKRALDEEGMERWMNVVSLIRSPLKQEEELT